MTKISKNEKGLTLITLAITVILLVIITATLASNSYTSMQLSNLTKLQNDIEALNDRVAAYYVKNDKLPIHNKDNTMTRTELASILNDMSANDGDTYYTIDIEELENLSLNYGHGYRSLGADRYIINEQSHVIYYYKGVVYDGLQYHTIGAHKDIS